MVNPYMRNGFSHHYHLDESNFIFRGIKNNFEILFHFYDEIPFISEQNSLSSVTSWAILFPLSHKRDARRKCLNQASTFYVGGFYENNVSSTILHNILRNRF